MITFPKRLTVLAPNWNVRLKSASGVPICLTEFCSYGLSSIHFSLAEKIHCYSKIVAN